MSARSARLAFAAALSAAISALAIVAGSPGPEPERTHVLLTVGFGRASFAHLNRNDAQAAFQAFAEAVGRRRGYDIEPRTLIFDDSAAFLAAIRSGEIRLAIVKTWDYVSMDVREWLEPVFIPVERDVVDDEYLLVTRRGSGLGALGDLRGKKIILLENSTATMPAPWIETQLRRGHLGSLDTFFTERESVGKPSAAVLPVFFGKADACVVDRSGFEVMTELNPQIGERLQVIATSDPYAETVVLVAASGWASKKEREDLIGSLSDLHTETAGRQILALFRVGQMIPYRDDLIDSVRRLKAEHTRYTADASGTPRRDAPAIPVASRTTNGR